MRPACRQLQAGSWLALFILGSFLIVSCRRAELPAAVVSDVAQPARATETTSATMTSTFTHTPTETATPSSTPSPTKTPTPTLTPTATAVAININGNPRVARLQQPTPQSGARCGVVDIFDFPIDPPDAANVPRPGGDFGLFRRRYDKYHAGEDWSGPSGRQSFGSPVYSIGHGLIMYAAPDGWGRDKGVVIIQHTLPDRRKVLSFYGHLDPPSVNLKPGECIQRGDQVGNIGRPRSSPHLHFEVRTHMPYQPGPGYWPEDPTTAGWLPPSQTIWENRMAYAPGVLWLRPSADDRIRAVGQLDEGTYLILEAGQVKALDVNDGRVLFQSPEADFVADDALLVDDDRLLLANRGGRVAAFNLPEFSPLWQNDGLTAGIPTLMPLPQGGVLVAVRDQLFGLDTEGALLWEAELPSRPLAWTLAEAQLILTTAGSEGGVFLADVTGLTPFVSQMSGLVSAGARPFLYDEDGIYQLDLEAGTAELVYALPPTFRQGQMVVLPDGGVLVAQADARDRRLIVLNEDGSLRWERSYADKLESVVQFLIVDDQVYLVAEERVSATLKVSLFALDMDTAVLTHLFQGGTQSGGLNATWVDDAENSLLLNIGWGHLLAFDPQTAVESITQSAD